MADDDDLGKSRDPLFSDYERLGNLLTEAQKLGQENSEFNPATIRKYFVVLAEIFRFMYPIVGKNDTTAELKEDFDDLDIMTRKAYRKLLTSKEYKVPAKLFELLGDLHQDLLFLKQNANLGVRIQERLTAKKKAERAMD